MKFFVKSGKNASNFIVDLSLSFVPLYPGLVTVDSVAGVSRAQAAAPPCPWPYPACSLLSRL